MRIHAGASGTLPPRRCRPGALGNIKRFEKELRGLIKFLQGLFKSLIVERWPFFTK
jgi:hypothetical protein